MFSGTKVGTFCFVTKQRSGRGHEDQTGRRFSRTRDPALARPCAGGLGVQNGIFSGLDCLPPLCRLLKLESINANF
jgi:hypothetical protein